MTQALYAAGFITVGVESRSLALVRILREKGEGLDIAKSYLLLDVDNSGIDFLIVRNGRLYFEYANPWSDLADDKGQITVEKFEETLASSLRQVMNFYSQHWPEPLAGVILSAAAFKEEAEQAVKASLALPIVPLAVSLGAAISPEWYVAFGCSLRGLNAGDAGKEINLSGGRAMDVYHKEQMIGFFTLWRILVPAVLGFLIVVLVVADNFLYTIRSGVESETLFNQHGVGATEVTALEASSTAFNRSVAITANAESQITRNYMIITEIDALAAPNNISVNSISFQAANTPILLAGTARTATDISAFKDAIQGNPHFGTVTLPLLNIQQSSGGGYSFSMSFPLSSGF
jgi:hypothetical protein